MANFNKQFNFRNGVQVDDDNLVVNGTGLVGIGTTIPTELLDVRGNVKISGFSSATSSFSQLLTVYDSAGIGTINLGSKLVGAGVSIASGIITAADSVTGIVTYFGDARFLQGMPTSQWIDIDAGLGYTSIYAAGNVGIATIDPRFTFQIGGSADTSLVGFTTGVGISSVGNVLITGVTTSGTFVGIGSDITDLNASNIVYGTIGNDRLPVLENSKIPNDFVVSGIITANTFTGDLVGNVTGDVVGNVTGTATTAASLTPTADVDIADLTVGVATVSTTLIVDGNIGIGTSVPGTDLIIKREGLASRIAVISDTQAAVVSVGKSDSITGRNAEIRYGNLSGLYPYSSTDSFDLINHGKGNFNFYLDVSTIGINTGSFFWHHQADDRIMTLTYEGNLGIGVTEPSAKLHVGGGATFAGDVNTLSNLIVGGTITAPAVVTDSFTSLSITSTLEGNVNATSGVSTFTGITVGSGATLSLDETSTFTLGVTTARPGHIIDISQSDAFEDGDNLLRSLFIDQNGSIGIGTTASVEEVEIYGPTKVAGFGAIAIGTSEPTGAVDFASAGIVTSTTIQSGNRFMVPPKLSTTDRNSQVPISGAMIYNTTLNKLQVYTGSAWETVTST